MDIFCVDSVCYSYVFEKSLLIVCVFTLIMHMTETIAYSMRYAGLKTKQIAIAMSFVTSTLLITRLSNMCQAPFLGLMVDNAILDGSDVIFSQLILSFRVVIFSAAVGVFCGMLLT